MEINCTNWLIRSIEEPVAGLFVCGDRTVSCSPWLMFKQEIPLLLPENEDAKAVQAAMWDPFEYLIARQKDGLLKTDFKTELGHVSYHIPCHSRVQNVG